MKWMRVKSVTAARLGTLSSATAALAMGGVPLLTTANASDHHHGAGNRTVGVHNTTISNYSPTDVGGVLNMTPTVSGGQNSKLAAFCPKAPCRVSQGANMSGQGVAAHRRRIAINRARGRWWGSRSRSW